jgi:hypothetical protein
MSVLDERALAQRVLEMLAESLLGTIPRLPAPATNLPAIAEYSDTAKPPKTISTFCRSWGMSRSFFYGLKSRGLAPSIDEIIVPGEPGVNRGRGLKHLRISAESERAWVEQMAQLRAGEAAELEVARAREQRVEAGKSAARSPLHISKQSQQPRRRRRRSV